VLGLAVYREFGPAADPGVVFFLGQGLLEVSGRGVRIVLVEVPERHPLRRDRR
jgi:hypothetical protein